MDARARLCELAKPHVSRMPRGVLRRLLVDRLADIAGVDPAAIDPSASDAGQRWMDEAPPPAPPGPAPVRASRLEQQLLRCLLRNPALFQKLDASLVADLFDATDDDSLFVRVARWAGQEGDADASVLLARFVHEPDYDELRKLADSEQILDAGALEAEFVGGVRHYLEERERRRRRALVDSIRNNPTKENVALYLSASRAAAEPAGDDGVKTRSKAAPAAAK